MSISVLFVQYYYCNITNIYTGTNPGWPDGQLLTVLGISGEFTVDGGAAEEEEEEEEETQEEETQEEETQEEETQEEETQEEETNEEEEEEEC